MHLLINIDVPDLPAAEALYTNAFGLTAGRRFGDGGVELLGAQAGSEGADGAPQRHVAFGLEQGFPFTTRPDDDLLDARVVAQQWDAARLADPGQLRLRV